MIYFVAIVIHNYLIVEKKIENELYNNIKDFLHDLYTNGLYKEKNKIFVLKTIMEEAYSVVSRNTTISSNFINKKLSSTISPFQNSKYNEKPTNKVSEEIKDKDKDKDNLFEGFKTRERSSNLNCFKKLNISKMRTTEFGNYTKTYIDVNAFSKETLNSFKSIFENNNYDFTFMDKLYSQSKSFETVSEVSNFSFGDQNNKRTRKEKINNNHEKEEKEYNYNSQTEWYFDILEWSGLDIAMQLTVISYEIYNSIKPSELINCAWTKIKTKQINSPNVLKLIDRFNKLYLWIIEEILSYDKKALRYKVVEKFIVVALYLKELRNFNDLVVVISALNSYIIKGMEKTLFMIGNVFKTHLMDLNSLCSYDNNYSKLRKALNSNSNNFKDNSQGNIGDLDISTYKSKNLFKMILKKTANYLVTPILNKKYNSHQKEVQNNENDISDFKISANNTALPYLGVLLRDLGFSSECAPLIKDGIFINIERINIQGKLINDYLKCQDNPFYLTFQSIPLLNFLRGCKPLEEDMLFEISKKLEPKFTRAKSKHEEKRPSNTDYHFFYMHPDSNCFTLLRNDDYKLISDYFYSEMQI